MANGRKIDMGIWLNNTGRQFCPDCEIEMIRKEDCYWECRNAEVVSQTRM